MDALAPAPWPGVVAARLWRQYRRGAALEFSVHLFHLFLGQVEREHPVENPVQHPEQPPPGSSRLSDQGAAGLERR